MIVCFAMQTVYYSGNDIHVERLTDGTTFLITWNDVFATDSRLLFEITIGTTEGGSDILQWVETLETRLIASSLYESTDYYITLTAINAAGLYKTVKHTIIGWSSLEAIKR